ncbi:ATP-grasp domain-containing protein [Ornithinimicrobium cerasi]|uniref:Carbamoyl-phosphate synthase L chain, ATP binding domain n=1 Tax=Ornithinimicrobium cerasi TaxID=2248773 RepID=A0A285VYV1_9MICO|nr:ATP-grasp domain-containing protein [Ornithinimicrobium cerasi]SOC58436.1 Carbamoyl-phosphate synthase L chain, ATP binding domain [Ornithinimicrobium cerasi]
MNIVFVEPHFPKNQREFPRALASVGARVIGIGETPWDYLDDELKSWMVHYEQVGSVTDRGQMTEAVRRVQGMVWVDRMESTIEAHQMVAAQVREDLGIPGTSVRTTWLCRDKPSMKEALRQAGVPTAASTGADDAAQVWEFARRVGYPLILKPRDAAGAAGTYRVDDDTQLRATLDRMGGYGSIAVEEFVEGHEGFYDTVAIDGQVALDFASHYYPGVLEAMRNRWISPQFVATNRIDGGGVYAEIREMGERVNHALGIGTSATHMEWFYGPKGLKFSEIGCRPPGVGCWDLYNAGNDMDVYAAWAEAVVHGRISQRPSRSHAAGIIALRPDRDGQITGYSGLEDVENRLGRWIIDAHIPSQGTPTQPVEAGFMANAWIRMKHPDYDHLRAMLDDVGRTVQVHAG